MSSFARLRPRLTRIAARATSGSRPMASSTWLAPTLPDEQAAPALTAMPARSSAITSVSAACRARRCTTCWARRGASAPMTTASGVDAHARRPPAGRAGLPCGHAAPDRRCAASAAAAPKPAMAGTFSVPARRRRSWPPPVMQRRQIDAVAHDRARRRPSGRRACAPTSVSVVDAERRRNRSADAAGGLHGIGVQRQRRARVPRPPPRRPAG